MQHGKNSLPQQLILHKISRYCCFISRALGLKKGIGETGACLPNISNPVTLYCSAPGGAGGAGTAGVQQPAVAPPGGLQPLTEVAEPVDRLKKEGDKSQPGLLTGAGHGEVSTIDI